LPTIVKPELMVEIVSGDSTFDVEYAPGVCWNGDAVVESCVLVGELLVDFPNMSFSCSGLVCCGFNSCGIDMVEAVA
jgi:hypothetical protein